MDGRHVLEFALHDPSARKQTDTFGNLFATENPIFVANRKKNSLYCARKTLISLWVVVLQNRPEHRAVFLRIC